MTLSNSTLSADFKPFPAIYELGEDFYSAVKPASFPSAQARFLNQKWADKIGLHLNAEDWEKHFHRFEPLPKNIQTPLALKYHGHQFHHYNPEIGDGRGFLFAQFLGHGKLIDLGTKGSGQTPYSRNGDGRLTLKGAFREALATELLEALGVNTSKTFCFFETGESLTRNDEPSPTRAAVLTRLSHSHIRFGTFQRLAYFKETANIKKLVQYCIQHFYPELLNQEDSAQRCSQFLSLVAKKSAETTAQWMMAGFVHGVLNSDNMNITGESFDYGPYRFLPNYDPGFTAAYFDHAGLYAFGRQPHSVYWNLQRLGEALQIAYPGLLVEESIKIYQEHFSEQVIHLFLKRLNLKNKTVANPELTKKQNEQLLSQYYYFLSTNPLLYEQSFFDFFSGPQSQKLQNSPQASFYQGEDFLNLCQAFEAFEVSNTQLAQAPYYQKERPCSLIIDELEGIWKKIADQNDWTSFNQKITEIRQIPAP